MPREDIWKLIGVLMSAAALAYTIYTHVQADHQAQAAWQLDVERRIVELATTLRLRGLFP